MFTPPESDPDLGALALVEYVFVTFTACIAFVAFIVFASIAFVAFMAGIAFAFIAFVAFMAGIGQGGRDGTARDANVFEQTAANAK